MCGRARRPDKLADHLAERPPAALSLPRRSIDS